MNIFLNPYLRILPLILILISTASRKTCFMPKSLLIMEVSSKSILWLGLSKILLPKGESKEIFVMLELKALVMSSLCCCRCFLLNFDEFYRQSSCQSCMVFDKPLFGEWLGFYLYQSLGSSCFKIILKYYIQLFCV